ncbi:MAG TPA: ABC transporter ATP-binding protein [Firmicutes bacterium]|nr:ABC transporter ATP-binding protein [Bacillota bacterium]
MSDLDKTAADESGIRSDQPGEDLLLRVDNLATYLRTDEGTVKAVDGVSFTIRRRHVLGIVGESGCGKSMTALSIMQLIPRPHGRIHSGHIFYYRNGTNNKNGTNGRTGEGPIDIAVQDPRGKVMRSIRGAEIAMIFQEPMTSLNPVYTIGEQIAEVIRLHQKASQKEALDLATEMLSRVGIPSPSERVHEYPHQLSGGMRQRAMIAMALSCNPRLLIADEPTTALDVTIQAQILDLIRRLQDQYQMSLMLITHNLGVVCHMCDDVAVMYMGKIVEYAPVHQIFRKPRHPYTIGLLNSIPNIRVREKRRLVPIEGSVPDPFDIPEGCRFAPRCPQAMKMCREEPPLAGVDEDHEVRCWLYA